MGQVRGSLITNTVLFVQESFGPAAHERVLAALPQGRRATFEKTLRDASWVPFEDMLAYMEAAKALLAPDDSDFFLRMGRFSGTRSRLADGFEPMVADRHTATRMATLLWHALHDTGRIEILAQDGERVAFRILDFPSRRAHCQRIRGALEGILSSHEATARAREVHCRAEGSPDCEMEVVWTPAP